ncbi:MAG: copper resistance protein CopC [Candidatus Paceibacterota bacterium]
MLLRLFLSLLLLTLDHQSAYAHAEITGSSPANSTVIKVLPKEIILSFNEAVSVEKDGIQLLNASGKILSSSAKQSGSDLKLVTPKIKAGRYLVRYRVISADGHIIIESITFSYGLETPKSKPLSRYLGSKGENIGFFLSGSRAGENSFIVNTKGLSGRAEFKNTKFGAPILVNLSASGNALEGKVLIPSSGKWSVIVRVRVSDFEERVLSGVIDIKA